MTASRSKRVVPVEQRKDPRFPVHWPMVFSGAHKEGGGTVTNLSMHGCAVESHTRVPTGTRLELCALFPKDHRPVVPDLAVVRWSSGGKFGLEFLRIRPEEQARLRRVVSTLDSGPSPLSKSEGQGPTERRRAARFPVQCTLDFLGPHAAGDGTVSDLSMGGCQVDTKASVYIGMYLPLRVYLPGQETPLKVDQAVVRWAKKEKYGFEFMSLWPEEQARLRHFVSTLETGPSH